MSNNYYSKQYTGNKIITWKNFTDTSTPLSAANLQKSHSAINDMDNAIFAAFENVDQTKVNVADIQNAVQSISFNQNTGVFTFTLFSGQQQVIDTNLEKIVVNFDYNPLTQKLELTQSDGTVVEVDLSAFIANPDFVDSDEIGWQINSSGEVRAYIKNNSITDSKMQPNYLSDITQQAGNAAASATTAQYNAKLAQSYANGTSNLPDRPTEGVDNALYYKNQAEAAAEEASQYNSAFTGATSSADGSIGLVPKPLIADKDKYLKGDGSWESAPSPSDFTGATSQSAGTHGLVPAPTVADKDKFLKGDGDWATVPNPQTMQGATSSADGQGGLVPKPSAGDENKALLGSGTWGTVIPNDMTGATSSTAGSHGLVPAPSAGDNTKFLKGDGSWANVPTMTGATASTDGTSGLVPVPHMGDENKFIRGDGSWASAAADDNAVKTLEEWNALPLAEKIKFKTADITDDFNGSPVDDALSDTSSNPVQNRVVKAAIDRIGEYAVESLRNVKGTIEAGGLYRIGSIHVLNVRLKTTENLVAGDRLALLPFSVPGPAHIVYQCTGYVIDSFNNILRTNTDIPNGTLLIISGVCIA